MVGVTVSLHILAWSLASDQALGAERPRDEIGAGIYHDE
jgi:hypothetical protein